MSRSLRKCFRRCRWKKSSKDPKQALSVWSSIAGSDTESDYSNDSQNAEYDGMLGIGDLMTGVENYMETIIVWADDDDDAVYQDDKPVPYTIPTPAGLPPGTMVTVMGEVKKHADRFAINVKSGRDCVLHINPRFDSGEINRNSYLQGAWGPEERSGGMPVRRGQPFGCLILAQQDRFMIAFNGQHFTEFQFRSSQRVDSIEVKGGIHLSKVEVASNPVMPMPPGSGFAPPSAPGFAPPGGAAFPPGGVQESAIYSAQVPFIAKLGGGMHVGRSLCLSCIPKNNHPDRIRIDLQKGREGDEIALHMDIRFNVGEHHRVICMNSFKHGHWGNEEKYRNFPFNAGVGFDLVIRSDQTGFTFFVNGEQLGFFQHRDLDLSNINHVHVQGALKITRVAF